MQSRRFGRELLTYGLWALRGKAVVAFLLLASPLAAEEPVTVLAFGDSLTQGYGLPQEDGFVPQLSRWLSAHGTPARLINGGVSGDTTQGGAARIGWSLTEEVDAMILALGGNDLLRGIDPEVSRANLETILAAARDARVEVLLIGLEAPGNYGPEYKAEFDAIYPDLAEEYGALHIANFLSGLGEGDGIPRDLMQTDGIHPNAAGVARIVKRIGPSVQDLIALTEDADGA